VKIQCKTCYYIFITDICLTKPSGAHASQHLTGFNKHDGLSRLRSGIGGDNAGRGTTVDAEVYCFRLCRHVKYPTEENYDTRHSFKVSHYLHIIYDTNYWLYQY